MKIKHDLTRYENRINTNYYCDIIKILSIWNIYFGEMRGIVISFQTQSTQTNQSPFQKISSTIKKIPLRVSEQPTLETSIALLLSQ